VARYPRLGAPWREPGQWQLLALSDLRARISDRRVVGPAERRRVVLPPLDEWASPFIVDHHRWALVLTALEARYLPTVDPEWLHLTNVEVDEWHDYRTVYDPIAVAEHLEITPEEIRGYAERLLLRAHRLDPTGDWSDLIRRAPRRTWQGLTGDALIAVDHRLAAEVLLLFYEDLAVRGRAAPLPDLQGVLVWHPLHDRISAGRADPVDRLLARLGVSPHPGVVLVVEGEIEELIVPRVFDHLELRRTPDLVRILCMRGADKQLPLVAAVSVAPLLGERRADGYDMIRPPTRLMIAVDQDRNWSSEAKVEKRRRNVIGEIEKVVAAEGATLSAGDLETLVVARQWPGKCFEFAHFTDDELAAAMMTIHPSCGGFTPRALIDRVATIRASGRDIKDVWDHTWVPKSTKVALAEALWPVLKKKIDDARWSETEEMPRVAEVVREAYLLGQQSSYGSYVIRAADRRLTVLGRSRLLHGQRVIGRSLIAVLPTPRCSGQADQDPAVPHTLSGWSKGGESTCAQWNRTAPNCCQRLWRTPDKRAIPAITRPPDTSRSTLADRGSIWCKNRLYASNFGACRLTQFRRTPTPD
jgi:hypothetical protein